MFLVICVSRASYADVVCSRVVTTFALAEVSTCTDLILLTVGAYSQQRGR